MHTRVMNYQTQTAKTPLTASGERAVVRWKDHLVIQTHEGRVHIHLIQNGSETLCHLS